MTCEIDFLLGYYCLFNIKFDKNFDKKFFKKQSKKLISYLSIIFDEGTDKMYKVYITVCV